MCQCFRSADYGTILWQFGSLCCPSGFCWLIAILCSLLCWISFELPLGGEFLIFILVWLPVCMAKSYWSEVWYSDAIKVKYSYRAVNCFTVPEYIPEFKHCIKHIRMTAQTRSLSSDPIKFMNTMVWLVVTCLACAVVILRQIAFLDSQDLKVGF